MTPGFDGGVGIVSEAVSKRIEAGSEPRLGKVSVDFSGHGTGSDGTVTITLFARRGWCEKVEPMRPFSFKRHRFPPEIICHSIWLYARFTLSFRDIEEMLAERGLDASYETIRRWFVKFGTVVAANLRRTRPKPSDY